MKITALVENTSNIPEIGAEHGLSLYIETCSHKILFDMGQSDLFYKNAVKLGINLAEVDVAVLSHGHYDHGGGLKTFLSINNKAKVYLNKNAFESHYNGEKYIGLDMSLKDSERLVFVNDYFKIDDVLSLYSLNDIERKHDLGSFGLSKVQNGVMVPDDFLHEQYLLIEENSLSVLISGCSHKGIMDIADFFDVDTIIGGFHFSKLPLNDMLKSYALHLKNTQTEFITCHCTGENQYEFMQNYMDNLSYISAGESVEIIK